MTLVSWTCKLLLVTISNVRLGHLGLPFMNGSRRVLGLHLGPSVIDKCMEPSSILVGGRAYRLDAIYKLGLSSYL